MIKVNRTSREAHAILALVHKVLLILLLLERNQVPEVLLTV
jgi:hypothetical protein